jgi:CBS domain-containing protein
MKQGKSQVERQILATTPPSEHVSTIMSTKVVTVKPTEKVAKALGMMVRHKIGSVVVVDKGKPVGILTERDVSTRVAKGQNLKTTTLKTAMSKPLITALPSMEIEDAVAQMVKNDIRRLPILEEGKLVGIVTERNIMYWLVKVAYEPNIPEDLKALLETRTNAHALPR